MRPQRDDVLGGRYRLTEPIAVGGMGEVWRASDQILGRDVAVKILKEEYTGNPGFLERFRAEARHTAALAHPNIATTYDYGEAAGSAFLVMELVPGQPLSDILTQQAPLPPQQAAQLLAQAARGLAAAHAVGVVHRDVKPGNLLVTPDSRVKVTDFGIARAADAAPLTATGQVMGTAQYLAPEQAMGRPSTPASDVYALGVVGYEMLTGERPFTGESQVAVAMAHVTAEPPTLPVRLPAGVRALVERSLAKDPGQRPADGEVFARAAEAASRGDDEGVLAVLGATAASGAAAAGGTAAEATELMATPNATAPPPTTAAPPSVAAPAHVGPAGRRRRRMTGPLLALLALVAFLVLGALLAGEAFGPRDEPGAITGGEPPAPTAGVTGENGNQPTSEPLPPTSVPPTSAPPTSAPPTSRPPEPAAPPSPAETSPRATLSPPTQAPPSEPAGIRISAADYVGRPEGQVRQELEGLGLRVQTDSRSGTDATPNSVIAISEGTFQEGDTVTITVAAPGQGTENDDRGN